MSAGRRGSLLGICLGLGWGESIGVAEALIYGSDVGVLPQQTGSQIHSTCDEGAYPYPNAKTRNVPFEDTPHKAADSDNKPER